MLKHRTRGEISLVKLIARGIKVSHFIQNICKKKKHNSYKTPSISNLLDSGCCMYSNCGINVYILILQRREDGDDVDIGSS